MADELSLTGRTFSSFRIRAFRRYFVGQSLAQLGMWIQTIAEGWLALELSNGSGIAVGLTTTAKFLPALLLSPWIGVLIDRTNKRRMLMTAQATMAALTAVLFALTHFDRIELWSLYLISFLFGIALAVETSTRQAFIVELVDAQNAGNAISLNAAAINTSRIVGPLFAGVMIVAGGIAFCFLANAAVYLIAAANLHRIRRLMLNESEPIPRAKGQISEGFRYVRDTPDIRAPLLLVAWVGVFALNFPVVLPLFAKETFHGDASTYSYLTMAIGVGALMGAFLAAGRRQYSERLIVMSGGLFGACILMAAVAPFLEAALIALVAVGLFNIVFMTTNNTVIQIRAEATMRGRVVSFRQMAVTGSTPLGGIILGFVVEHFGARWGLSFGAAALLTGSCVYGWDVRRRGLVDRMSAAAPIDAGTGCAHE